MMRFIRDLDLFGPQVTMFYKGNDQFTSRIGGLCTIILILLSLAYFAV